MFVSNFRHFVFEVYPEGSRLSCSILQRTCSALALEAIAAFVKEEAATEEQLREQQTHELAAGAAATAAAYTRAAVRRATSKQLWGAS